MLCRSVVTDIEINQRWWWSCFIRFSKTQTTSKARIPKFGQKLALLGAIWSVFYRDFIWLHEQQLHFKLRRWLKLHAFQSHASLYFQLVHAKIQNRARSLYFRHMQVIQRKFKVFSDFIFEKISVCFLCFFLGDPCTPKDLGGRESRLNKQSCNV